MVVLRVQGAGEEGGRRGQRRPKRVENRGHAVALHVFHSNFIRKNQTLKTTPAVAAGIPARAQMILDLVAMVEREERLTRED